MRVNSSELYIAVNCVSHGLSDKKHRNRSSQNRYTTAQVRRMGSDILIVE